MVLILPVTRQLFTKKVNIIFIWDSFGTLRSCFQKVLVILFYSTFATSATIYKFMSVEPVKFYRTKNVDSLIISPRFET